MPVGDIDDDRRRRCGRQLPADGAHRRADGEPLPSDAHRLQRLLLPRPEPARGRTSRRSTRRLLFGVPRVCEKIYSRRQRRARRRPRAQGEVRRGRRRGASRSRRAERAGTVDRRSSTTRGRSSTPSRSRPCAASSGSTTIELAITGAAPIPREVLEWFTRDRRAAERDLRHERVERPDDVVARTRTSPGSSARRSRAARCAIADDGEVICRGGNVFEGYLEQPEKTAETLIDGWLHTGDIGEIDDDGYLSIVDRKKELIITSGGKNISPANLEAALKMIPLVGQAAAIGDNRKFISAIARARPRGRRRCGRRRTARPAIDTGRAGRRPRRDRRGPGRRRRGQRAVRPGRADQASSRCSARSGCPTATCSPRRRSSSAAASTPATPTRSRRCTPEPRRTLRGRRRRACRARGVSAAMSVSVSVLGEHAAAHAAVGDVRLAPHVAARLRERRPRRHARRPGRRRGGGAPSRLLEPVEPAAQARRHGDRRVAAQLGRRASARRLCSAASTSNQRERHARSTPSDPRRLRRSSVRCSDRRQSPPQASAFGVERGIARGPRQAVALSAVAERGERHGRSRRAVTTSGGIQRSTVP